jgi:ribose-phosphate pyrophosphokinase
MTHSMTVFGTQAYTPLTEEIAKKGNFERGHFEQKEFPDGERYHRLITNIEDVDVALIGGTISDRDTLELYDLGWAIVESGAKSLTLVIPFFGYATMERSVHKGEVVMAKSRANLLSSIPEAGGGNRIVLLDLHSEGIPYYFDGHVRPVHLYAKKLIMQAAKAVGSGDFVLASTDAGRAKWVESLASDLGVEPAFVYKRRINGEQTQITGVSAQVENKQVIIYDDMIRTGGSLIQASKSYRDAGATDVVAIATHGLFPGDSLEWIEKSGVVRQIVCTDSHPRARALESPFLKIISISELLVEYLQST